MAGPPRVPIEPLTSQSFAPFGSVLQNPATSGAAIKAEQANQGSATKYADITGIENYYHLSENGRPSRLAVSMFVCSPRRLRQDSLLDINILERHPYTTQTFVPLGLACNSTEARYLVIVAPTLATKSKQPSASTSLPKGRGLPDVSRLRVFLASGHQAVTYGAGTWHAPMIVVGNEAVEFVVTQFINGVGGDDCQEEEVQGPTVNLHSVVDGLARARARARAKARI
jgi:ureidoglycolate lyase